MKHSSQMFFILLAACSCGILNGAEFINGIYGLPPIDVAYEWAAKSGFTHVINYVGPDQPERQLQDLELCKKYGLKMGLNVYARLYLPPYPINKAEQELRAFARRFRNHPALGFYYLRDEPERSERNTMMRFWKILKEEDPAHPVALCLKRYTENVFGDCADWLMGDDYPVVNQPFPQAKLTCYSRFIRSLHRFGRPVIAIGQYFIWSEASTRQFGFEDRRYANIIELRYFMYSALSSGENLRGMFWYVYAGRNGVENVPEYRAKTIPHLKAFAEFVHSLQNTCGKIILAAQNEDVSMILLDGKDGSQYLVVTHDSPLYVRSLLVWPEFHIPDADLIPVNGSRNVNAEFRGEGIRIHGGLTPWESLVFKIVPRKSQ